MEAAILKTRETASFKIDQELLSNKNQLSKKKKIYRY
jgi:hypothetical protein